MISSDPEKQEGACWKNVNTLELASELSSEGSILDCGSLALTDWDLLLCRRNNTQKGQGSGEDQDATIVVSETDRSDKTSYSSGGLGSGSK